MLDLANLSLTVFAYVTEENNRVVQALYNCMPSEMHSEKLTKISSNSQFGDPLVIYSYETDNEQQIQAIAKHIGQSFSDKSRDYLGRNLEMKTDLDTRSIYLRLDKYKAYDGELFLTEGSDVIKLELSYNAYTKDQNCMEEVETIMRNLKLID